MGTRYKDMKITTLGLILLTLEATCGQADEITNPSAEEVLNYEYSDGGYGPPMDRVARNKFSRIMRSDKFARIVREPNKLMRILRNGEQKFARIMRSDPNLTAANRYQIAPQMRGLRTPEIKFTRILRGEPKYLRILRSHDGNEDDFESDM